MRWYPKTPGDFNKNLKTNQGVSQKPRSPSPTTTMARTFPTWCIFPLLTWSIIKFQHYLLFKNEGRSRLLENPDSYEPWTEPGVFPESWRLSCSKLHVVVDRNQTSDIPNKINKKTPPKYRVWIFFKMMGKKTKWGFLRKKKHLID